VDRVVVPVAIALGSNLGDRRGHLLWAAEALADLLPSLRLSSIIETEPVGVPDDQPPFLNAAATGTTTASAAELLTLLQDLERRCGRERPYRWAPRTLDLDLIFYGDQVIAQPELVVPHPRFRERLFVLQPLAELAADWVDPVTGRTVGQLLAERERAR
jgi:2-amino-4-hydroxy-6-hydroxymethyldihydropteridine diphosphokinase